MPCEECEAWLNERGVLTRRGGQPVPRPKGAPTPCWQCPKIPPGRPDRPAFAVELSDRNRRCWDHYREHAATGWRATDAADPLVQHHAEVIAEVVAFVARRRETAALEVLKPLLRR